MNADIAPTGFGGGCFRAMASSTNSMYWGMPGGNSLGQRRERRSSSKNEVTNTSTASAGDEATGKEEDEAEQDGWKLPGVAAATAEPTERGAPGATDAAEAA